MTILQNPVRKLTAGQGVVLITQPGKTTAAQLSCAAPFPTEQTRKFFLPSGASGRGHTHCIHIHHLHSSARERSLWSGNWHRKHPSLYVSETGKKKGKKTGQRWVTWAVELGQINTGVLSLDWQQWQYKTTLPIMRSGSIVLNRHHWFSL